MAVDGDRIDLLDVVARQLECFFCGKMMAIAGAILGFMLAKDKLFF